MNRKFTVVLVLVVALIMIVGSIMPTIAEARDRYGPHFGFWGPYVNPYWGPPYLGCNPWNAWCSPSVYVPPLYPLFAPSVVVPQVREQIIIQSPQTYIQQQPVEQQYWYLCKSAGPSGTYYPYVQSCPGGWVKVVPQTAPPQ